MKKIFHILIFLFSVLLMEAQDPQFSQFYASPLYLCPSLTGATDGSRATINFRDQWPQIPGAFITYAVAFDHYFQNINSGFGVLFTRDQAGTGRLGSTNMGFLYSYNIQLSRKWQIRPGFQFLRSQRGIDFNRLTFGDQIIGSGQTDSREYYYLTKKVNYMDFNASILAYSEKYWGGLGFDHLIGPNQSLYSAYSEVPLRVSFYGGAKLMMKESAAMKGGETLTLAFLYKSQRKFDQIDLGVYWHKSPLVLGAWYRGIPLFKKYSKGYQNNDAIILLVGYKIEEISIGYSYDFTISRLVTNTGGAHEISIVYLFNQDRQLTRKRKNIIVPCPKF